MSKNNITICACISRSIIDKQKVADVANALQHAGYSVNIEADLCQKVIFVPEAMPDIAQSTVIACYPRAVVSLFKTLDLVPAQVLDIRNNSSDELLTAFRIAKSEKTPDVFSQVIEELPAEYGKDAWYPVLDKERCIECKKCHDFCLFGVYAVTEGKIKVTRPNSCKNNCPACARTCPMKAVIFPKYEKSPINGGLADEEQTTGIDQKAIYSDALRYKLTQRRASGFLLKKDEP